jgi:hypothetical protein
MGLEVGILLFVAILGTFACTRLYYLPKGRAEGIQWCREVLRVNNNQDQQLKEKFEDKEFELERQKSKVDPDE